MFAALEFDLPRAWQLGLPLMFLAVALGVLVQKRRGHHTKQILTLAGLRLAVLIAVVLLIAKPVWEVTEKPLPMSRTVALLVDRSESMSLDEGGRTRYQQANSFVNDHLAPSLRDAGLILRTMIFAQTVEPADASKLAKSIPDGKRSNLGGGIAQALSAAESPLAVIACTDGAVNETADDNRALSALLQSRVPFIGVGFGNDQGVQTLNLRQVDAPPIVPPDTEFNVSAYLEAINLAGKSEFEIALLRDGAMVQKKSVQADSGSRAWLESFPISEKDEGVHQYSVQLLPPRTRGLTSVNTTSGASVRIRAEKELRVLFVQGALTWDYKFIGLALKSDQSIKVTGITRTSKQSVFRQNVETAGELLNGFPTALEGLAPFRVIVLTNLKPTDLTPAQQELLARFCGELGGGLLMIGGAGTFDHSWQGSRLEQLLPGVIAGDQGVQGLDRPFRLQLTDEALQHPVFQITDDRATRQTWLKIPTFTQYARMDSAKPGAQIWAVHSQDSGPKGRRLLMASQRYGAGLTAVLCVQNFWRWRLAKEAEPQQFDRFWKQLFRFLAEARRQDVTIHLPDQELRPQMDVRISLEKQPSPQDVTDGARKFLIQIRDGQKKTIREETVELRAGRAVDMTFRAETAGLYSVNAQDQVNQPVASRTIEIRDTNFEYQNTGRNMEILRQWAALSEGLAVKAEDCRDPGELVAQIKSKIEKVRQGKTTRRPIGVNVWTLSALVASLGAEWLLRKRWGLL
jgi:uncharacterized membrane protein